MDSPVYKLEQVVQSRNGMEDFEGPLDLILHLLSKNKIEIQDIPIALILDQYLAYLERRQQMDLEIASDFIAMATHLMFIKTRMLLSVEDKEAQNEMDLLIQSLEERRNTELYARIKAVVAQLEPMGEFGRNVMVKPPERTDAEKRYLYDHTAADLLSALREIASRTARQAPPSLESFSKIVTHEPYPVSMKAGAILEHLKSLGPTNFRTLFADSRSRSEVVATFLAVLELCRNRLIHLSERGGDCTVSPVQDEEDTVPSEVTP